MPSEVVYNYLAQISIASGMEIYLPEEGLSKFITTYNSIGAKFISGYTDTAALHYRNQGNLHYLKLVGPKAPKGGGFYLSPHLPEKDFLSWIDAFTKGFLGREIAIKLGSNIQPPYTTIEKINILEEQGTPEKINEIFADFDVVEWSSLKESKGSTKPKSKSKTGTKGQKAIKKPTKKTNG